MTVTDEEIREWARSTDRPVGAKGRVSGELRAEYERLLAEAAAAPPAGPGPEPPAGGPESDAEAPGPAREETQPRKVKAARGRVRERLWGRSEPKRRRPSKLRDRVSLEKLATRGWETAARILQPVNLPVARCIDWQSATAGPLLEDALAHTVVDRILQPVARIEDKLEVVGALVGPPLLIAALQMPHNQPTRKVEVTDAAGNVKLADAPWPAGMFRQQVIMSALIEALDMCVEAQEKLPAEVRERQRRREQRREEMRELIQDVFFAPPPGNAAAAQAEEEAMARAREKFRGA